MCIGLGSRAVVVLSPRGLLGKIIVWQTDPLMLMLLHEKTSSGAAPPCVRVAVITGEGRGRARTFAIASVVLAL